MPRTIFYLILLYFWLMLVSMIYLVSLPLALPGWVVIIFIGLMSVSLFKWVPSLFKPDQQSQEKKIEWFPLIFLAACLAMIVYNAYPVEQKYGHWDAWWFWNVRANYLSGPGTWRAAFSSERFGTPFTVPVAHSDYPPFLPLVIGSVWRMLGMQPAVIPFAFSMLSLLLIPVLLFWDLYPKNKLVAIAAVLCFIMQQNNVALGCTQTADGLLGLFILLSFISLYYFRTTGHPQYMLLMGVALGLCLWTKNEGIIITSLFMLFTLRSLLVSCRWKHFLSGIAVSLTALFLFKLMLAPTNDLVVDQHGIPWGKIGDLSRYKQIWQLTWAMVQLYFPALPYLFCGYFIFCLIEKAKPDMMMWLILACFASYLSVFVISPHGLEWHVNTSVDRLIFQLEPAFIWIIAQRASRAGFIVSRLRYKLER